MALKKFQRWIIAKPFGPHDRMVMKGQKYPITKLGVRNLTSELIDVASNDVNFGECDVRTLHRSRTTSAGSHERGNNQPRREWAAVAGELHEVFACKRRGRRVVREQPLVDDRAGDIADA